ncbi:MAG TPA: hypothetical protein VEH84_08630, partial [Alphaproteobacteria bacterium]|nr:hypothetical protein [Alphaproteobacteria bacterium]
ELFGFLVATFGDSDFTGLADAEVARRAAAPALVPWHRALVAEGRALLAGPAFPDRAVAQAANRHFESPEAAQAWFAAMLDALAEGADRAALDGGA